MRGRKPKTPAQWRQDGDTRKLGKAKHEAQATESVPVSSGLPKCPAHLKGVARKAWVFLSEQLATMQQDRMPDAYTLEGVCVAYSQAIAADAILEREGQVVDEPVLHQGHPVVLRADEDGSNPVYLFKKKPHPAEGISRRAWAQYKTFCVEFGLSPVSRVRLSVQDRANAMDPWEAAQCESTGVPASALQ